MQYPVYVLILSLAVALCSVRFQVDERALRDIMEMGFSKEAARQALLDNSNNVETALNCLLAGANQAKAVPAESSRPPPRGRLIIRLASDKSLAFTPAL